MLDTMVLVFGFLAEDGARSGVDAFSIRQPDVRENDEAILQWHRVNRTGILSMVPVDSVRLFHDNDVGVRLYV